MFEYLEDYQGIIVTGAHRSGTTITGRMIAYDLDRQYVTETQLQEERGKNIDPAYILDWMRAQEEPFVLHGATCYAWITKLQMDNLATVYVTRPFGEIRASQAKINIKFDSPDKKYLNWSRMVQRGQILRPYIVKYHDLKSHPLWEDSREDWEPRQISSEGESAFNTKGGREDHIVCDEG